MRNVVTKTLYEQRKSLFWWTVGITALVGINTLSYPSIRELDELNKILEGSQGDAIKAFVGNVNSLTSPEGFLNSQIFFLTAPIMLLIDAVGMGTAGVAGEESRRTLPLVLATAVTRLRFYLSKWVALLLRVAALTIITVGITAVTSAMVDIKIPVDHYAALTLSLFALTLLFGTMALALGAALGRRAVAAGVIGAVAVASYFLNSLASLIDDLGNWQKFSPFYLYSGNDPLVNGLNWRHLAALVAATLVVLVSGWLGFRKRDITN